MNKTVTVLKDVISTDVVSANPQDTLREALALMVENSVSALPVVDARGHCLGMISVTDLLGVAKDLSDELSALSTTGGLDHKGLVEKLEHADLLTEPVQGWMSPEPISVGIESTILQAARLMLSNRVHRLVVLDEEKRVLGVVSTMDLLAAFAEGGG